MNQGWQGGTDEVEMDDGSGTGGSIQGGIFSAGGGRNSVSQDINYNNNSGGGYNPFKSSSNKPQQGFNQQSQSTVNNNSMGGGDGGNAHNPFGQSSRNNSSGFHNNNAGGGYSQGHSSFSSVQDKPVVVSTLNKISADDLGLGDNEEEEISTSSEFKNIERRERHRLDSEPHAHSAAIINSDKQHAGVDLSFAKEDDPFANIPELAPTGRPPTFADLDKFGLVPEHAPVL